MRRPHHTRPRCRQCHQSRIQPRHQARIPHSHRPPNPALSPSTSCSCWIGRVQSARGAHSSGSTQSTLSARCWCHSTQRTGITLASSSRRTSRMGTTPPARNLGWPSLRLPPVTALTTVGVHLIALPSKLQQRSQALRPCKAPCRGSRTLTKRWRKSIEAGLSRTIARAPTWFLAC